MEAKSRLIEESKSCGRFSLSGQIVDSSKREALKFSLDDKSEFEKSDSSKTAPAKSAS